MFGEPSRTLSLIIRQQFPKAAMVTFKKYAKEVLADLHFGAVEGINYLTGQDLIIVGTPHVNSTVYTLIAYGLGIQLSIWDYTKFKYTPVQRNGYESGSLHTQAAISFRKSSFTW